MNEEEIIDEMIEDTVLTIMEALNVAIIIGDYKKANSLLDILSVKKKSGNGKVKGDVMVA